MAQEKTTPKVAKALAESAIEIVSEAGQAKLQAVGITVPLTLPLPNVNPSLVYSAVMNEFIPTLVNKIGETIIWDKRWRSPLSVLKRGQFVLGDTIEEIHTNPAEEHAHDEDGGNLFSREIPDSVVAYHRINRDSQYKRTIQRHLLTRAFTSFEALASLIDTLIAGMFDGNEQDEWKKTKSLVTDAVKAGHTINVVTPKPVDEATAKTFSVMMRTYAYNMAIPSTKNNAYMTYTGATTPRVTQTAREDQVLLVRSDVLANMDVNVLADAFNVPYAEIPQRIVPIDFFSTIDPATGEEIEDANIFAVLADKDWVVIKDIDYAVTDWVNPSGRFWNYFLNVVQIYSVSPFANVISFSATAITPPTPPEP